MLCKNGNVNKLLLLLLLYSPGIVFITIVNLTMKRRANQNAHTFAVIRTMGEKNLTSPFVFPNIFVVRFGVSCF